tara:strand:+ start:186 stop:398 length:213 start_codon:yes stop_codon:yes gene_type:complete
MAHCVKGSFLADFLARPVVVDAGPLKYLCWIDTSGMQGWIAPDLVFLEESGRKSAQVNDGLIARVLKKNP